MYAGRVMTLFAVAAGLSACSSEPPASVQKVTVTPSPSTSTGTAPTSTSQHSTTTTTSVPPVPPSLQRAADAAESSVVRFEVASCTSFATGSGFLIGPSLVVTAAHVVDKGQVIRVIRGTVSTAAEVIGQDTTTDIALVRTAATFSGGFLTLATEDPKVEDPVVALGYTRGAGLTRKEGHVTGLDRKVTYGGVAQFGMIEIDSAINHGDSGGPVITADGTAVGIVDQVSPDPSGGVDQGRRLLVSGSMAKPIIKKWANSPTQVPTQGCANVIGPDGTPLPADRFPASGSAQALHTLNIYFDAINNGDFPTAVAQLATSESPADFKTQVASSSDDSFTVESISLEGGAPVVWLSFKSKQAPGKGPSTRPQETARSGPRTTSSPRRTVCG